VSPSVICCIVRRALKRAGLAPEFKGAHLLRHSLATNLLRRGASLVEIGQLLRHSQPNTTQIYAKVDITALRAAILKVRNFQDSRISKSLIQGWDAGFALPFVRLEGRMLDIS